MEFHTGDIVKGYLGPVQGHEQDGYRYMLVVSSEEHVSAATELITIMPITTTKRPYPNRIAVTPTKVLPKPSWIISEQIRTIDRSRVKETIGSVDKACTAEVLRWIDYWYKPAVEP